MKRFTIGTLTLIQPRPESTFYGFTRALMDATDEDTAIINRLSKSAVRALGQSARIADDWRIAHDMNIGAREAVAARIDSRCGNGCDMHEHEIY